MSRASAAPVILVQGCKGGVGKSFVTMAVLDWLETRNRAAVLVESDTSNSDCGVLYLDNADKDVPVEPLNLDVDAGWMDLGNLAEKTRDRAIVVNGAARNMEGLETYGASMFGVQALRPVVTLWVLKPMDDCIGLLADYLQAMRGPDDAVIGAVHVLCNQGAERERDFSIYEQSNVATTIRDLGGKTLLFPTMARRLAHQMFSGKPRRTIGDLVRSGPLGNRAEAERWQRGVHAGFRDLLGDL